MAAHILILIDISRLHTQIAASEVSSILEGRIAGASTGGDVQETGRVLSELLGP